LAPGKKNAARLNAWLVFLDESGLLMAPLLRRTWSPCGHTPILQQTMRHHRKVSAIAALCVAPTRDDVRWYFRLHADANLGADHVIAFLQQPRRHLPEIALLWDRLNAHRARRTQAWLHTFPNLHAAYFPAYAPELNPMEYGWNWLKSNPLANLPCLDLDTLVKSTRCHSRSLQRQPHWLRSFIEHSPLPLRLK
jgi:transposase